MTTYEERMAPLFSQMLLQREFEQLEILRKAHEQRQTDAHALARPAQDYVRFERAARELEAVRTARRRISTHHYGRCELCSQPIDLLRLNAFPTDPYCLSCEYKRARRAARRPRAAS